MSTNETREVEKEQLCLEIRQLDNEINALKEQLSVLEQKKKKLQRDISKIEYQKATETALKMIEKITPQNSREITFDYKTKTTPIMDSFYNSKDLFLVIKRFHYANKRRVVQTTFGSFTFSDSKWISLIIIKLKSVQGTIYTMDTGLTMTDLKKAYRQPCLYGDRLSALETEISKIDITQYDKGQCVSFENICYLGAQTYRNQTGYGSEYHGEELVHEGTLYGETTGFLIIGVRIEN